MIGHNARDGNKNRWADGTGRGKTEMEDGREIAEDPFRERERESARVQKRRCAGMSANLLFFFLNSISFHFILRRSYKSVRSFLSVGFERP